MINPLFLIWFLGYPLIAGLLGWYFSRQRILNNEPLPSYPTQMLCLTIEVLVWLGIGAGLYTP